MTRLIGDIHCKAKLKNIMIPGSIQLGDLCLLGYENFTFKDSPRYFIEGNHDFLPILDIDSDKIMEIRENLFYIPRGFVSGKVLFIGGADSIDKYLRHPGYDWFPEESLTQKQFERIMDNPSEIEVVISHDAPTCATGYVGSTSTALDIIWKNKRPKLWVYAHHHVSKNRMINHNFGETRFIGLAEKEYLDIDIPLFLSYYINVVNFSPTQLR